MDAASVALKQPSALDLLAALLMGRDGPEGGAHWASSLAENFHLLLLTTSLALLVRRSSSAPRVRRGTGAHALARRQDQGRAGTRRRQAEGHRLLWHADQHREGFAKALAEEAKARYDKAIFKVVDLKITPPTMRNTRRSLRRRASHCSSWQPMVMESQLTMWRGFINGSQRGIREASGLSAGEKNAHSSSTSRLYRLLINQYYCQFNTGW